MDLLAEIALTILVRGYIKEALSVSSVNKFWRYTLACALACRELSQFTSINAAMAYTGGLLHDVGRLALMAAYPDKYGNLLLLGNNPEALVLAHSIDQNPLYHTLPGWLMANAEVEYLLLG